MARSGWEGVLALSCGGGEMAKSGLVQFQNPPKSLWTGLQGTVWGERGGSPRRRGRKDRWTSICPFMFHSLTYTPSMNAYSHICTYLHIYTLAHTCTLPCNMSTCSQHLAASGTPVHLHTHVPRHNHTCTHSHTIHTLTIANTRWHTYAPTHTSIPHTPRHITPIYPQYTHTFTDDPPTHTHTLIYTWSTLWNLPALFKKKQSPWHFSP